ncbi:3-oxoacyl-ACP synthase [Pleurocapsales cyanobacterium LEGE 06147]|nr:3-oxoacyl-ACP synthase [Pleurocapsales cyanobacterium LEGE 06147]
MINLPVGISALAVSFPSIIRTNDYWQQKFPELVAQTQPTRTRLPRNITFTSDHQDLDIWSQEVAPYLSDPFRGNVERRVLASEESSFTLEGRAARDVLSAAKFSPEQVELMMVASLFPEQIGPGHAVCLARQLELNCPAWNLESTCSSALVALQNACALVRTGEYRNVLVVVSQIGSNSVDEQDTLSWSMGDGAGAFLVSSLKSNQGILASKIVHTAATCGAYLHKLVTDEQDKPRLRTRTGENASTLAETAVEFVRNCCEGAMAKAGVTLEQINFFAFNTPTPWYANVCRRALGIAPERTINLYPRYANIGPVLPLANLYHAAIADKIHENDLVLVYTNGATATAAATVMRWGEVPLGPEPAPPISITEGEEEITISSEEVLTTEIIFFTREELLTTALEEWQQKLENYLLKWLAISLQQPLTNLHSQQSLAPLLDSLMAFELKRRIETDLQIQVPIEKLFADSNISQLAELLINQLTLENLINSETDTAENKQAKTREKFSL